MSRACTVLIIEDDPQFRMTLTAYLEDSGYSEIILIRMEKDSPLRHFVEQVLTSADRAAELTNSLLAFSRRQVLHTKPIDLSGVVRGLKKMLRRLLPEDIDFRTTVTKGNLIVMADKGQIEQILMNLVTNAKDAMPRGGPLPSRFLPLLWSRDLSMRTDSGNPEITPALPLRTPGTGWMRRQQRGSLNHSSPPKRSAKERVSEWP